MEIAKPQILYTRVADLVPSARNPRVHPAAQIKKLRASIREFGFIAPVIIDAENNIIAGEARVTAAEAENIEQVPCVLAAHLSEAQLRAYMLADNRLAEYSKWDMGMASIALEELESIGFDLELTGFCANDIAVPQITHNLDFEDDRDNGASPIVALGDIWQLGRHRLMCGDCTDAENVRKLRGETRFDMYLTDPPYNVDYEGKTADALLIANDNLSDDDFERLLQGAFAAADYGLRDGGTFYIFHSSSTAALFEREAAWKIRQVLIWVKNAFVLSRQDYHWQHEPCLYGWKEGVAHFFGGDRKQSTVLYFDKPTRNAEHPTIKPTKLFDYLIRNGCPRGGTVFDGFGGAGTTLLACEDCARTAFLMELDPRYCDVIIRRWETQTGKTAIKI